jgi:hypothetical protein
MKSTLPSLTCREDDAAYCLQAGINQAKLSNQAIAVEIVA